MTIFEMKEKIAEEELCQSRLTIHDSRIIPWIDETRPPYSITLNIIAGDCFAVYCYDECGYKNICRTNLTENDACELVLDLLRNRGY